MLFVTLQTINDENGLFIILINIIINYIPLPPPNYKVRNAFHTLFYTCANVNIFKYTYVSFPYKKVAN